ncbi:Predicted protein [Wolbachia endosymbiont strain TRS of Brugia malayi]|nr:Predicted protein [Wolbachia endosymbiont strain TRS of Brugia malayi]
MSILLELQFYLSLPHIFSYQQMHKNEEISEAKTSRNAEEVKEIVKTQLEGLKQLKKQLKQKLGV